MQGSDFDDYITGNSAADKLVGNRGTDTLKGAGGADIMNAGKGNGQIADAGNGADVITHDIGTSLVLQNTGIYNVTLVTTKPNSFVVDTFNLVEL